MENFRKTTNAFNFVFERELKDGETVIVKMPKVSPNKRGVNDIGWQSNGDITIYGTLSSKPESNEALWQKIVGYDDVNKTVSAIRIVNNGSACRVIIRALLN